MDLIKPENMFIYDVGTEPEKDCDYKKSEKTKYDNETTISLTRISFVKQDCATINPNRTVNHKTGSIKTQY